MRHRRLLLLLSLLLSACTPAEPPPAALEPPAITLPDSIRLLDPAAAKALIDSQPRLQVIDCRMEDEFLNGHLPGAYHVNYFRPEETRQRLLTLDPTRPALVYCSLGTRSRHIALSLTELGFKDISLLDGGVYAWLLAKYPLNR